MNKILKIGTWLICMTVLIVSCDNKRDVNGDLGGMWQLLKWENKEGTVKTKEDKIYYCIQLNLIKFEDMSEIGSGFYGYFHHSSDSLIIYRIVENGNPSHPSDTLVSLEKLGKFGVPNDGRFHIDLLTSKNLILSNSNRVLTFRKY